MIEHFGVSVVGFSIECFLNKAGKYDCSSQDIINTNSREHVGQSLLSK